MIKVLFAPPGTWLNLKINVSQNVSMVSFCFCLIKALNLEDEICSLINESLQRTDTKCTTSEFVVVWTLIYISLYLSL